MDGYTLRIEIREDLMKLYKAALEAKRNRIAAMDIDMEILRAVTEQPFDLRNNIQAAALTTEQVAFARIGQFIFDRMEELEAQLEEIDRQIELRDQGHQPDDNWDW